MKRFPLPPLSDRIQQIPEAISISMNQRVYEQRRQGHDIVALSLGEAFFEIPNLPFHPDDIETGYHYTDSQGLPKLRQKIANFYQKAYQANVNADEELLITAGSKMAIFMAMQALLNSNDEVLIFEPAWLSYQEQARLVSGVPRFIPYDCPVHNFSTYFSTRSKLLIINNPNNPAGRLFTREELISIYRQCQTHGLYLLVDEAYSDFLPAGAFCSMAHLAQDKEGIIVVNSLSKNMGMSGWRVGYVIAQPSIIQALLKLNQHLITCAPSILQLHMARYFDDITAATLPQARRIVDKRRHVASYLDHLGLKRLKGTEESQEGTFYFFLSLGDFPETSQYFSIYLLMMHQIAVVPGSAYGETTERFIRVSIGTESLPRIFAALDIIQTLIQKADPDRDALLRMMGKDESSLRALKA